MILYFNTPGHCLARVHLLHYLHVDFGYKSYASVHANNATNAYAQGSAWCIEALKSLSCQRQSEYSHTLSVKGPYPSQRQKTAVECEILFLVT